MSGQRYQWVPSKSGKTQVRRRFVASRETTDKDLDRLERKFGLVNVRVNQERRGGTACELIFERGDVRYAIRCAEHEQADDNYRAVVLVVEYLYRIMESYGVTYDELVLASKGTKARARADDLFERLFLPYAPVPDDSALRLGDGTAPWWQTLAIAEDATPSQIESAYRALARFHHPDTQPPERRAAANEQMARLTAAYEQAKAARS